MKFELTIPCESREESRLMLAWLSCQSAIVVSDSLIAKRSNEWELCAIVTTHIDIESVVPADAVVTRLDGCEPSNGNLDAQSPVYAQAHVASQEFYCDPS